MKWKEVVYMISDELKLTSDDSLFNEDHIIFLISKYRSFILNQRYKDIKREVASPNYQTICLTLEPVNIPADIGVQYMKSTVTVPSLINTGIIRVYSDDYFQGEITYISKDRMRYVGFNKYLEKIIYCAKEPEDYLYFKSCNEEFLELSNIKMYAIFEDIVAASELECNKESDLMEREFPMEEALIPQLIELTLRELLGALYRPEDNENNAADDLANIATSAQRNNKSK